MRVIAGIAKGHPLKAPKGINTRPTTDRIKEALFNILGPATIDSKVLDLFAGSGALGIEALSRGAEKAVFIEKDAVAISVLKTNLVNTKLEEFGEVYRNDINKAIQILAEKKYKFDLIFLDPPYEKDYEKISLEEIHKNNLLAENGLIVVESSKRTELPKAVGELNLFRQEKYGDTLLNFYKKS